MAAKDLLAGSVAESSATPTPSGAGDKRQHDRYYFRALATAVIHPPAGPRNRLPQLCYVLTRDLSRAGISFLHPVALTMGQRVELELSDCRKFTVVVIWIKQWDRNCFCMGCKFERIDV
jgi:hypothetical protein